MSVSCLIEVICLCFSADPSGPIQGEILSFFEEIYFLLCLFRFAVFQGLCRYVLSLALRSGGCAGGTLRAVCLREEAMKSTPTLLGGLS